MSIQNTLLLFQTLILSLAILLSISCIINNINLVIENSRGKATKDQMIGSYIVDILVSVLWAMFYTTIHIIIY